METVLSRLPHWYDDHLTPYPAPSIPLVFSLVAGEGLTYIGWIMLAGSDLNVTLNFDFSVREN